MIFPRNRDLHVGQIFPPTTMCMSSELWLLGHMTSCFICCLINFKRKDEREFAEEATLKNKIFLDRLHPVVFLLPVSCMTHLKTNICVCVYYYTSANKGDVSHLNHLYHNIKNPAKLNRLSDFWRQSIRVTEQLWRGQSSVGQSVLCSGQHYCYIRALKLGQRD